MRRIFRNLSLCGFFIIVSVACSQKEKAEDINAMDGVEDLTIASSMEGVVISWKNPNERRYDKVELWYYEGEKKIEIQQDIEESFNELEIGLEENKVYKFFLQAKPTLSNQIASVQSIKGRKLDILLPEDELEDILKSVEVYGGDGGFRLIWENPNQIEAGIVIEFEEERVEIDANKLTKEYTVPGLEEGKSYEVLVQIKYAETLTSFKKTVSVIAKTRFAKLINEGWGITASSEETQSEDGAAINLLDDNSETYWRSKVSSPAAPYPHYVIIDLKKERKIYGITLTRRKGDDDFSSWDNDISLSKDGVNFTEKYSYAKNPPESNPIFNIEFNRTIEGEQMYLLPYVHTARYIKVEMLRGSKTYAIFGDINIYGE